MGSGVSQHTTTPTTVELWVRSFSPTSTGFTRERALERLDELESCAPIESVEVDVWGREVEQTRRERRIPHLDRIETRLDAFETWAARTGRRLEPFFRDTRIESAITGESYDVWRLPTVALAEFDANDELVHVAPCRDGKRTVDVFDRIDELVAENAGRTAERRREEPPVDRASSRPGSGPQGRLEPSFPHSD